MVQLSIMHWFPNKLSRTASSLVGNFYGGASFRTKKCFTCSSRPVDCQTSRKHAIPGVFVKWGLLGSCRNSSFATGFTPLKAKSLGSIIDIGRAEHQSPEDLAAIWDDVIFSCIISLILYGFTYLFLHENLDL